jgi:hypothetical protein
MKSSQRLSFGSFTRLFLVMIVAVAPIFMSLPAGAVPSVSTVTFFENASVVDSVSSYQIGSGLTALKLVTAFSPPFANAGQPFVEWTTSADGSGVHFSDGAIYSFANDISLYAQWKVIPVVNTVTFYENRTLSDGVSAYLAASSPTQLTSLANLVPTFSNVGYTFVDWATTASGGGTHYANGANYGFANGLSLFAQWTPIPIFTANFTANGGNGTIAPVTSQLGATISLPSSAGITNVGHTFIGWNTTANGSGTEYAGGATYVLVGDQTLFAQWTADVYSVTYSSDGGVVSPSILSYTFGTPAAVLPTPTLSGSSFMGWFSAPVGGSLVGLGGASFIPVASVILYAQWSVSGFVVTYSSNGGLVAPATANYLPGSSPILLPTPTNAGSTFSGWFTALSGGTLVGLGGTPFTPVASVTLFAEWSQVLTDTLTFDANGGSGSVTSISGVHGSSVTLPGQDGLLHAGFLLAQWNTAAKGTGTSYAVGQKLTLSGSSTLYAQWSGHAPARLLGAVGSFKRNSTALSAALKNQVKHLASYIKVKKYHTVTLYGYTSATGLSSLNLSVSRARATVVAKYLRSRLSILHVKGVVIRSAGEGAIGDKTGAEYSRVEVFVL